MDKIIKICKDNINNDKIRCKSYDITIYIYMKFMINVEKI